MKKKSIIDEIKTPVTKTLLTKKGETTLKTRTANLDKDIKFENGKIYYKNNECGSYDLEERTITIDQQKCINNKGLNPITSHPSLPSNAKITIKNGKNRHIIETDELARRTKFINIVKEKIVEPSKKNRANDEQTKAKGYGDEDGYVDTPTKIKDQGGHFLAASAGGLKEMINIFSQAFKVNNSKEWKQVEDAQRSEYAKNPPNFVSTQKVEYEGKTKRPKYITNGVKSSNNNITGKFNNSNSDKVPVLADDSLNQTKYQNAYVSPVKVKVSKGSINKSSDSSSSSINPTNIFFRLFFVILGIIILLLLFFWIKDIFPFDKKDSQLNVPPKTELVLDKNDLSETPLLKEESIKSKLSFAKPLDDLTKSVTDISEFNSIVENENILPVIGSMFEYNSAEISNDGKAILAGFANEYIKLEIPVKVIIEGFTCTIGSAKYNKFLGGERAKNLKSKLINLGVDKNIIVIKPIGKKNFVSTNNVKNDLILNRRSNVTIMSAK